MHEGKINGIENLKGMSYEELAQEQERLSDAINDIAKEYRYQVGSDNTTVIGVIGHTLRRIILAPQASYRARHLMKRLELVNREIEVKRPKV